MFAFLNRNLCFKTVILNMLLVSSLADLEIISYNSSFRLLFVRCPTAVISKTCLGPQLLVGLGFFDLEIEIFHQLYCKLGRLVFSKYFPILKSCKVIFLHFKIEIEVFQLGNFFAFFVLFTISSPQCWQEVLLGLLGIHELICIFFLASTCCWV